MADSFQSASRTRLILALRTHTDSSWLNYLFPRSSLQAPSATLLAAALRHFRSSALHLSPIAHSRSPLASFPLRVLCASARDRLFRPKANLPRSCPCASVCVRVRSVANLFFRPSFDVRCWTFDVRRSVALCVRVRPWQIYIFMSAPQYIRKD